MRRMFVAALVCAGMSLAAMPAAFASNGKACPPTSHNPGGSPACGFSHHGKGGKGGGGSGDKGGQKCPASSKNPGGSPPCGLAKGHGKGHGGGSGGGGGGGGGGTAACGPADQGGTSPNGGVSGPVYAVGQGVSGAGAAPIGDAVQTIACAVNKDLNL